MTANIWMLVEKRVHRASYSDQLGVVVTSETVNAGENRLQREILQRLVIL